MERVCPSANPSTSIGQHPSAREQRHPHESIHVQILSRPPVLGQLHRLWYKTLIYLDLLCVVCS